MGAARGRAQRRLLGRRSQSGSAAIGVMSGGGARARGGGTRRGLSGDGERGRGTAGTRTKRQHRRGLVAAREIRLRRERTRETEARPGNLPPPHDPGGSRTGPAPPQRDPGAKTRRLRCAKPRDKRGQPGARPRERVPGGPGPCSRQVAAAARPPAARSSPRVPVSPRSERTDPSRPRCRSRCTDRAASAPRCVNCRPPMQPPLHRQTPGAAPGVRTVPRPTNRPPLPPPTHGATPLRNPRSTG